MTKKTGRRRIVGGAVTSVAMVAIRGLWITLRRATLRCLGRQHIGS